jgi:dTDP-4-dehydrorhamnose 3,5-epimerase
VHSKILTVEITQLAIDGAFVVTPKLLGDSRGLFAEVYKSPEFTDAAGHPFGLKQINCSVSAAGTIRGIHYAEIPPSQAKYIMCPKGAILDIVVDIRVGSPTFGQWEAVLLDDVDRKAIYLSEGLGHAFCALEDGSTVVYLCSEGYNPTREHSINPLDPTIGVEWPTVDRAGNPMAPLLSDRDTAAPSFKEAEALGMLPTYQAAKDFIASLA